MATANNDKEEKGYVYVFNTKEEMEPPSKFRQKICQIFPSLCGSMICLPFGIMLGWPSPTYPNLVEKFTKDSPVPISIDESAMVAGFLMIGNTVSTPFSSWRYMGAKYNIIIGAVLMTAGWILMWQAKDLYWLLGSRFLIGAGYGYGVGQLKYYIKEMCETRLAQTMIKQINLYVFFGVIVAFAYGPFVDFRKFSIIAMILSIFVVFLAVFLPLSPRQLMKEGKEEHVEKSIVFLNPNANVEEEIVRIREELDNPEKELNWCDLLIKRKELRRNFFIFTGLVFFQQFSGVPATIVYSQVIFKEANCPRPELCALVYAFVYFLANAYGIFCIKGYNKKHLLLSSAVGVSIIIVVQILVLVERVDKYWQFTSVIVLIVFNVVHTVGLGNVPFSLIVDLFPKEANKVVVHFFIMFHSMLALTITKIFQVMMDRLGLFAPFCLFLTISTASIIYVIVFVPNKKT